MEDCHVTHSLRTVTKTIHIHIKVKNRILQRRDELLQKQTKLVSFGNSHKHMFLLLNCHSITLQHSNQIEALFCLGEGLLITIQWGCNLSIAAKYHLDPS